MLRPFERRVREPVGRPGGRGRARDPPLPPPTL